VGEAQALAGYAPSGNRRACGAGVQDRQHCLRAGTVPGPIRAALAFSRAVIPDANLKEGRQSMKGASAANRRNARSFKPIAF